MMLAAVRKPLASSLKIIETFMLAVRGRVR